MTEKWFGRKSRRFYVEILLVSAVAGLVAATALAGSEGPVGPADAGAVTGVGTPSGPGGGPPAAVSFDERHRADVEKNPPGVVYHLEVQDGQREFHMGEIIPLSLSFSSNLPNAYKLAANTYDHSGRMPQEMFVFDPTAGVVDPLRDYYESGLSGFMGGGLTGTPVLTTKPSTIPVTLNEWIRFDRPGAYRLYAVSRRIFPLKSQEGWIGGAAASDVITIQILPEDPTWAEAALRRAVQKLDAKDGAPAEAACVVRYLGTKAAGRVLVERLARQDDNNQFSFHAGILGFPDRSWIIKEIEQQLAAQDYPVTPTFLSDLSLLQYYVSHPTFPAPYPAGDVEKRQTWLAEMQRRREDYNRITAGNTAALSTAVDKKKDGARLTGLRTLLAVKMGQPSDASVSAIFAELVAHFTEMPAEGQRGLLQDPYWAQVRRLSILPVLRGVYSDPPGASLYDKRDIRTLALRRIAELAPAEGRRMVLEEISRPDPRVDVDVLSRLPDASIPALDSKLAANLESAAKGSLDSFDVVSALVARYASPAILDRVKAVYGSAERGWACAPQVAMLAYFLRADPAYGERVIVDAMAYRKNTGCFRSVLEDVPFRYARPGDTGTNPVIVKEAVHALYDPDLEVALNAATTLGRFGSRDAEAPLWERLQKWHDQWQSRSEDLVDSHGNVTTDERLGYALSEALRTAQAWVLNAAEVRELQGLCMGRQMLLDATRYNSGVVMIQPLEIGRGLLDSSRWDVGQYRLSSITSLEEKLAQYPPGTVFTVSQFFMSNHPDLTAKLKAFIEARDMKLELTASSRSPSTGQR